MFKDITLEIIIILSLEAEPPETLKILLVSRNRKLFKDLMDLREEKLEVGISSGKL